MSLLQCKFCSSNLVNLVAVKIKIDEFEKTNLGIQKNFLSMEDPLAIKHYLRCFKCSKITELLVKKTKGCTTIETSKHGEIRNEILGLQDGGRFN